MTQIFISRAELLPDGETTGDHKKWQKEEMELMERDKSNVDRSAGGLFRGSFKSPFMNLRPIRDDEDGVARCPRCMWELEDGLCLRCHIGLDGDEMMAEDFSEFDDRLSASTYDTSDEEMELEIDMEERDPDIDPDLWTQDDSDISLDGDGRPIHSVREPPEGGWGVERRGAPNVGGHARAAEDPGMGGAIGWDDRVRRWHPDDPTSVDEEEEAGEDEEAGSLDDFVVDDDASAASRSQRSPDSDPETISHIAYEGRARELNSGDANRSSREATSQLSDEEESDEGGGVSNGRRRVRSRRSQPRQRNVSQHVPGGSPILGTLDNDGDSDGVTDTLLQAGWSQLDQDEHEDGHHGSDILGGPAGSSNNIGMSRAAARNHTRHAASSSRNARRHRSHNPSPRLERLHRGQPTSARSTHTPQPSSARSNTDFIRRTTASFAPHARRRNAPSVASTGVDTTDGSNGASEDDSSSDHDLSSLEQFSPLASSANMSAATSRASSREISGTRLNHWRQHDSEDSESSGYETPSGHLPQFDLRVSSEAGTATVGRTSSVASSAAISRPPRMHMGPQSPIYIGSSPIKSEPTPSSVDRTSASQRSESPVSNHNHRRRRHISPRADSIPHPHAQGRSRGQTAATMLRAFNARLELQHRLSRPNIRGGGGSSTGASPSPYARQSTQSPEEREREQAAAEKAAEKAARRRAKDLRRQQQNPFLSAQSRLSRASRLLNEAADRYSEMPGQPGPSDRAVHFDLRDARGLWEVEGARDPDDDMW